MRRITVNTALEKFRSRHNLYRVDDIDTDTRSLMQNLIIRIMQDLRLNDLLDIIRELPPKYRMVFNLYAIEGYSHKEISRMVNISEGTSKSNLSQGKRLYFREESDLIQE